MANATIVLDDISGSIHSVSAQALGKTSNNGWTFWFVEEEKLKNKECLVKCIVR